MALGFSVALGLAQWSTGATAYPFATQMAILHWATLFSVFLIGNCFFADESVSRWFRSLMIWFAFVVAVLATLQTFSSDGKVFWLFPSGYVDSVMGPIVSRNHYAAFIEVVLPFALYRALADEENTLLYSAIAAAMFASVVASASRAGTILAGGEILAVVALMWQRGRAPHRAIGQFLLKFIILIVILVGVVGSQAVWLRLGAPDPMAVRSELAVSTIRMIAAHPWRGIGLGMWPIVYPRYAIIDTGDFVNQAHNDWLQWTAEGGIPFGLLMVGLFLSCLRPAFGTIWGLGVIAVFLHALVDYPFSRPALGSWCIVVVAMLVSTARRNSSAAPDTAAKSSL